MSSLNGVFAGLRIGPVPYLNARPLVWGLDPTCLETDVPATLSAKFFASRLDVALLPVFDILRYGTASIVDDVGIACFGEVYSVIVASRTSFSESQAIYLDPASRSSVALLRVLLAEYYSGGPAIIEEPRIPHDAARLLIGDAA
ncbi:MAG TPA: MqnA/MqnD/SBP family protein, partial [Terrimicrobiaceae bacterium]